MIATMLSSAAPRTTLAYTGHGITTAPPASSRTSVGAIFLRQLIRILLKSPASQKASWRHRIADYLAKAGTPNLCIDELLLVSTTEGGPDGLDSAIDILAKTGDLVLDYAWVYLQQDVSNWSPDAERAYNPNDDYWYILLRAVGRTDADPNDRFRFINSCTKAEGRGIREGAVEALRDLGTPAAKKSLREMATHDSDQYIRQTADEALTDLET